MKKKFCTSSWVNLPQTFLCPNSKHSKISPLNGQDSPLQKEEVRRKSVSFSSPLERPPGKSLLLFRADPPLLSPIPALVPIFVTVIILKEIKSCSNQRESIWYWGSFQPFVLTRNEMYYRRSRRVNMWFMGNNILEEYISNSFSNGSCNLGTEDRPIFCSQIFRCIV